MAGASGGCAQGGFQPSSLCALSGAAGLRARGTARGIARHGVPPVSVLDYSRAARPAVVGSPGHGRSRGTSCRSAASIPVVEVVPSPRPSKPCALKQEHWTRK